MSQPSILSQDHVGVEEEDPSLSSAALCISFALLGSTFRPVFTHQCFEGEWIRGYQPPPQALSSNNSPSKAHSSHRRFEDSTHCLSLVVTLAPSFRKCALEVHVSKKKREMCTRSPNAKRTRIDNGDHDTTESSSSITSTEDSESSFQNDEHSTEEEEGLEGRTRSRRMPIEEIIERISRGLLTTRVVEENSLQQEQDYLVEPLGTVLKEYRRKVNGVSNDFVLCLADGEAVADYHNGVQRMALWFIETADEVDLKQKDGGCWKVLYLFCRHGPNKYSLAGYTTLFHFMSPFKKPKPGIVVRICQVMVLPPYQRAGHGKFMLQAVYDDVCCCQEEIVEINVEDPAPAFVALRNRVDYELLRRQAQTGQPWTPELNISFHDEKSFFQPLSDAQATMAGAVAKLTPRQVQIALELYKLDMLEQELQQQEKNNRVECETKYRLMVKKRLVKVHREDLGAYNTKQEKQGFLARVFEETLEQYRAVLKIKR